MIHHGSYDGNVDTALKPRRRIHSVLSTLMSQRCTNVGSSLWRTSNVNYAWSYGSISTEFPQFSRLITAWHLSGMQGQYCDIHFKPLFLSHAVKFPTVTFKRFRKTGMDKMESCSPKLSIRNCPALNFISSFKTITFQKSGRKIFN